MLRARVVHAQGGEEGHRDAAGFPPPRERQILAQRNAEGPHGVVEAAVRKRRCPGCPASQLSPARSPSQQQGSRRNRRNLTLVGCCQAESQPGASLAKLLAAGNNGEMWRELGQPPTPPPQPCMFPRASSREGAKGVGTVPSSAWAPGVQDQSWEHKDGGNQQKLISSAFDRITKSEKRLE